jgi:hypothetical protein
MLYVKEFPSRQELEWFLQGKILGSKVFKALDKINVRNKTIVLTTPAVTITFPDTAPFEAVTPAEIVAEAESQSSGSLQTVKPPGGPADNVMFSFLTDGNVCASGTALAVLGLSAGTVGGAAVALADVAEVLITASNQYGLVYDA